MRAGLVPETLADLLRLAGIEPSARESYIDSARKYPVRIQPPRPMPRGQRITPQQAEARRRLADIDRATQPRVPRNQVREAGQIAMEMTGLPSFQRSGEAFRDNNPEEGWWQLGSGVFQLGTLAVPFGGKGAPRPAAAPRVALRPSMSPRGALRPEAPAPRPTSQPVPDAGRSLEEQFGPSIRHRRRGDFDWSRVGRENSAGGFAESMERGDIAPGAGWEGVPDIDAKPMGWAEGMFERVRQERLAREALTPSAPDGGARGGGPLPRAVVDAQPDYNPNNIAPAQIIRNPSEADLARLTRRPREADPSHGPNYYNTLRWIRDRDGNVYVGNSFNFTHDDLVRSAKRLQANIGDIVPGDNGTISRRGEGFITYGVTADGAPLSRDWLAGRGVPDATRLNDLTNELMDRGLYMHNGDREATARWVQQTVGSTAHGQEAIRRLRTTNAPTAGPPGPPRPPPKNLTRPKPGFLMPRRP